MVKRGLIFAQLGVRVINVFRLGVQCGSVHVAVVHAVFFTAGAAQFDFQSHAHFGHTSRYLEQISMFSCRGLFRQVDHVGREQRFCRWQRSVFFTRVQQTVDPRQQFLRAVVSVQDNRHAVVFSHLVNVMRARDSAEDSSALRNVSFSRLCPR